jgi:hypothetical protein
MRLMLSIVSAGLTAFVACVSAEAPQWEYAFNGEYGHSSCIIDVTTGEVTGATVYIAKWNGSQFLELVIKTKSTPHPVQKEVPSYVEIAGSVSDLGSGVVSYSHLDGQSSASVELTELTWAAFKDAVREHPKAQMARLVAGKHRLEVPLKGLSAAIQLAEKDCGL